MGRLLDYDPSSGVKEVFHKTDNGFAIQTVQDVAPVLEANKRARDGQPSNWRGDMHHIASIPLVIVQDWWKELGSDPFSKANRVWLIARLNNRDWLKLRAKEGRL